MFVLDEAVIGDAARLAAVERTRRVLPAQPIPLDGIARLAAGLLHTSMAAVTLVGEQEEFFVGVTGMPESLTSQRRAPLAYSVCKYVVSHDHPVVCGDMRGDDHEQLHEHLLMTEFGVRAFLGVPVRDGQDRAVGSLTVLDTTVRQWTDDETAVLLEIAELLRPPDVEEAAVATLDSAALLDSVQEAFLALDPDGVVVGFNRAAENLLGFTADQVCGRHFDDRLLPDYGGQPIAAALGRLFAAGPHRPVLREVDVRHRDGHRLTARASMSVVRGSAGPLACVFLTDLSERAAAQELADRHSSFLAALLDSLTVGVIACDGEGRVVLLNRVLREIQGLPATGAVPEDYPASVEGLLHDTARQPMPWRQTPLMRAYRGDHVEAVDVLTIAPGHPARIFATTAQPITTGDGRLLGAVAVAHELTAMRRAERFRSCHLTVQEVLTAAGSIAEATPHVLRVLATTLGWPCAELFLIDELTGELRPVGHWDASGSDQNDDGDFFGHVPVRGHGITGRVWQTERAMWVPDIAGSPDLNNPFEQSRVRACARHGIRTVLAVPVRDGGTLLGVLTCYASAPEPHEQLLTVLLDGVAAQLAVYVALRRTEQLNRQLARAQDDFIALVGHEMRTPLTSIAANAEMLGDDADALDGEHRQMVDAITRNTSVLQQIIDTLLELAGLESGHLAPRTAEVDLAAIVADAVRRARHGAADSGVRLRCDLPPRLALHGDGARLRQVVDDVLSNAVRYSPLGGDVDVLLTADDDMAELRVSDTGIGTPAQERDRVFDRFFRGSNVRHHGTAGSGLGLSLARTIVGLHSGTIRLTGNEPSGTVVTVRLPVRQPARPPA
jgi:PAS domain S-box-containing protein